MTRRVFHPRLHLGRVELGAAEAHHVRDVMRAAAGDAVELFDAAGRAATARIVSVDRAGVAVGIESIAEALAGPAHVAIASAVPKGDRADWLVEKLSELGVARWTPLRTARSVVHPEGDAKLDRWRRIAIEAAKQSRRAGVMTIDPLTGLDDVAFDDAHPFVLSTRAGSPPLAASPELATSVLLLIGPEGGWTDEELSTLITRGAAETSLTTTVLRIETAAIVAAALCVARRS